MKLGDGVQPFHAGDRVLYLDRHKGTIMGDIFYGFNGPDYTVQWFYVALDRGDVVEVSEKEVGHVQ